MLTYFWVAVGGALGSMARLWLGVYVATVTGPDGRIVVPMDARAFVMVGLCGGFTTFSAFSLQTLDLARDGRWLQAGANIMLSVVLCLVAVVIGHWLAALFGRA